MVSSLLPVIGVPLLFISFGGSAMVSSLAGIGMILAAIQPNPRPEEAHVYRDTTATPPAPEQPAAKPRTARRRLAYARSLRPTTP